MKAKTIIMSSVAILLMGCGGSGDNKEINTSDFDIPAGDAETISIDISKNIELITLSDNKNYEVNMADSNKDMYVVFTNNNIDEQTSGNISAKESLIDASKYSKMLKMKFEKNDILKTFKAITTEVRNIDEEKDFHLEMDENFDPIKTITAKVKLSREVDTVYGLKTLTIWVENNSFGCQEEGCVTQENIDYFADKFLKDGLNNDIYDLETKITGEEYNNGDYVEIIADTNEINILFYPSESNNLLGFVNYKDFFKKSEIAGSNELLLFNLNSFAINEEKDMLTTTIIHEFQHLVSFSRRIVEKEVLEPTWINELRSLMMEDLLAEKIQTDGLREVSPEDGSSGPYGNQYSLLNYVDHLSSLYNWNSTLESYGNASSLGIYLNRSFNGPELLSKLLISDLTGVASLEKETSLSINNIQKEWIFEEMASDIIGNVYNTGSWINKNYNNVNYMLGSVDLFKLSSDYKYNDTMPENVSAGKTWIYKKGSGLKGNVNISIPEMEENIDVHLIIK